MHSWDLRVVWWTAVSVAGTAFLAGFLVTGHHELLLTVWAVLMWVLVVPGIPAVVKWQQRRQS